MSKTTYKRLGDYIREVNVRNKELEVETLLGVSITKTFIPSIANTIGTDMSTYKIVSKEQFAYGPVTSRNGDKVSIALLKNYDKAIVSQAYTVFEIIDKNELLPAYLMMWFMRPEFDIYARYKSHGSAREIFDWDEMCNVEQPIPSLEKQQEIVNEYEVLSKRIALNESICEKLEQTAQALYRKMFVDDIDPENLPEGWRWGTIDEYCKEIKSGGTPSRINKEYWNSFDYRWLKTGEVQNNIIFDTEKYISKAGLSGSSAKLIPADSIIMAMYGATAAQVGYLACETTTNQACCNMICHSKEDAAFLYFHFRYCQEEIKRMANGGAQENLSQDLISGLPIIILEENACKEQLRIFINSLKQYNKENILLVKQQELLLSKLTNI